jgi:hypothetical protein
MGETIDSLILDLLDWLGSEPRPYDEVMSAWRTSCPRLPVWEDANERGFIERDGAWVRVSAAGREFLSRPGPPPRDPRPARP